MSRKRKQQMAAVDWAALERKCAAFAETRTQEARAVLKESLDRLVDLAIHTGRAKSDDLENAAMLARFLEGAR